MRSAIFLVLLAFLVLQKSSCFSVSFARCRGITRPNGVFQQLNKVGTPQPRSSLSNLHAQSQSDLVSDYEVPKAKRISYFIGAMGLLLYAVTLAPGGSPEAAAIDTQLIQKLISPSAYDGSVNALFVFLFNAFLIVPVVYGGLLLPAGKGQKYPTLAFVLASLGIGFFAVGPYLSVREVKTSVSKSDVGPGTNVFSNRFFAAGLLGFGLYLAYFVVQQTMGLSGGLSEQVSGFLDLFTHQRLVHVSALDMSLLSLAMADPMQEDIMRRYEAGNRPSAWTYCLFPILGPAVYLLTRPELPESA